MTALVVYHIPVCPFSQRLEILLALKGCRDAVDFRLVDITQPRPDWLMRKTRGQSVLPVLETADGSIIRESLVILQYLQDLLPGRPVAQVAPYRRAVEGMLTRMEGDFCVSGYVYVMNQDPEKRDELRQNLLNQYARLSAFLEEHSPAGPFLFEEFGWAETVFAPLFMRFWFLEYYEDFELPSDPSFARVRQWSDACRSHPAAQQVTREEIIKLYYDYAKGAGNGALLPGRQRSSFAFEPDWRDRPWPPKQKYGPDVTDEELGL